MIEAVAADGRRFSLHDDGTWSAVDSQSRSSEAGFRRASWGDSLAQVKASEVGQAAQETDVSVTYAVIIAQLNALAHYIFVSDRLVRAKYIVTEEHSSPELFLQDFARLDDLLSQKYGGAHTRNDYWVDDLYQDDPTEWGFAVSLGHLARYHQWNLPDITIVLALTGDNYVVNLQVEYSSAEFAPLEEQQTRTNALNDL